MIDIIGNIRIDETKLERVKYFVATLISFRTLFAGGANMYLSFSDPGPKMERLIQKLVKEFPIHIVAPSAISFGATIQKSLAEATAKNPDRKFYIHFEEDHFLELENITRLIDMIKHMQDNQIQLCRASFHKIEMESQRYVESGKTISDHGYHFDMNWINYCAFQGEWMGGRYFIGTNCIFSRTFAWKFWDKTANGDISQRPHDYERPQFEEALMHRVIIPKFEILRSLDDDHGLMGSSMTLNPSQKYKGCIEEAKHYIKNYYK